MYNSLEAFLDNKPLYYDKIDYDAISVSWDILKNCIELPYVIHIVGTNGKGSTGRILASFLNQLDKNILHYSSPHILKFNERIWINGIDSNDEQLNNAHSKLQIILPPHLIEKLTYFEYTTLIALYLSSKMDFIVLEAGLGGEFDATNVVKNDLTLITTIGLDHQDFLGDTIEEIASTKMRSCDTKFILGYQIYKDKIDITKDEVLKEKNELIFDDSYIDQLKQIVLNNSDILLPEYLEYNLSLSLKALNHLGFLSDSLVLPTLFGRFEYIEKNITIDVGHNPIAAFMILNQLQKNNQKVKLIYNSYKDKDYNEVIKILKPVIQEVQIIKCDDDRMVESKQLKKIINNLSVNVIDFDILDMNDEDQYLVFGSFIVVNEFLNIYKEKKNVSKR